MINLCRRHGRQSCNIPFKGTKTKPRVQLLHNSLKHMHQLRELELDQHWLSILAHKLIRDNAHSLVTIRLHFNLYFDAWIRLVPLPRLQHVTLEFAKDVSFLMDHSPQLREFVLTRSGQADIIMQQLSQLHHLQLFVLTGPDDSATSTGVLSLLKINSHESLTHINVIGTKAQCTFELRFELKMMRETLGRLDHSSWTCMGLTHPINKTTMIMWTSMSLMRRMMTTMRCKTSSTNDRWECSSKMIDYVKTSARLQKREHE